MFTVIMTIFAQLDMTAMEEANEDNKKVYEEIFELILSKYKGDN